MPRRVHQRSSARRAYAGRANPTNTDCRGCHISPAFRRQGRPGRQRDRRVAWRVQVDALPQL